MHFVINKKLVIFKFGYIRQRIYSFLDQICIAAHLLESVIIKVF